MVAVDVGQLRFLSRRAEVAYIFFSQMIFFFFNLLLVSDKPFNAVHFQCVFLFLTVLL